MAGVHAALEAAEPARATKRCVAAMEPDGRWDVLAIGKASVGMCRGAMEANKTAFAGADRDAGGLERRRVCGGDAE